ncbi:Mu transposase C-terminal domain-containing protein [Peribacillus glennii]|uniref:Integrase catalytic domain-containing protein n=1 Tax=Peribacillus glennii TaxID=2303991 RepID=A0A372L6L9_9BACI|nr:Mu transposase C-terminal domain-containing protein [Peribacillus glennii]RFU60740.1 hypothetical protein D0466_20520 [Peribacillus glennii]
MKLNQLKVNSNLIFRGRKYIILDIDPPKITMKRYDTDGAVIDIDFVDVVTDASFLPSKKMIEHIEEDKKVYASLIDSLSENEREKVSKRLEIIRPLLVFDRVKTNEFNAFYEFNEYHKELLKHEENIQNVTKETIIERIASKHSISSRTVKRYYSSYSGAAINNAVGEEGLISKAGDGYRHRSDNKILDICHPKHPEMILQTLNVRIHAEYIPIIKEVIEKEYLTIKKSSKKAIYDLIAIKCVQKDIKPPYAITIYKMLDRISDKLIERMRLGKVSAQKYEDISRGYANTEALYPLHIVEIDHTQLDIDVIDEAAPLVKGRPYITLGIDVYSRMVWCMHISFDPPSANKVRKAIEHGVLLKRTKERFNTTNEWPVFGIPDTFVFDNGSEFKNYKIKRLIEEDLKSHTRFRPIATPRYGGTIERLIGTLNSSIIHRMRGTRKSNIMDLGEYNPEENALLTLRDLEALLVTYITDIYHYEEHRGLPLDQSSPISRFIEGLKVRGYPDFIAEEDESNFKMKLLPTMMKPYTRDGIRHENRLYRSTNLNSLIDKREKKYLVKYDMDDISKVHLKHPETNEYIEVPCHNPSADTVVGMKASTFELLRKKLKEDGKILRSQFATDEQIQQEKANYQRKLQDSYKKSRRVRIEAERNGFQVKLERPSENQTYNKNKNMTYEEILNMALEEERRAKGDYE